jgi:monoamine oxidase
MGARVTRRRALVLGGGVALAPSVARAAPRRHVHDVIVVGAGLSGLTTADQVRRAGRDVLVLEARDRVGGRNLDVPVGDGVVELGGQWAGPGQDRVLALAKELGVATFPTFAGGDSLYYAGGNATRYSGDIPPADPATLVELEALILDLNDRAAKVPLGRPWDAPDADATDRLSVGEYIDEKLHTAAGRALAELAIAGVYGESASLVGLLDLLASIGGVGGDFNTLIGDAQSIRFAGGPQQLSQGLAKRVRIRFHTEVLGVEVHGGVLELVTRKHTFRARRIVLTPPRPVLAALRYRPALPPAYDQFLQRQPMGAVTKVNAIYSEPFWRADGLSGAVVSDTGPVQIAYDNSPPSGKPGVLVGFFEGNHSRAFFGRTAAQRRAAALACFGRYFGSRALAPIGYHDMVWASEPFTRGAYGTYSPPGVLTALGNATTGPVGPIHFAGDGTSDRWPGYMDGAIRSGERAAQEVLAEL